MTGIILYDSIDLSQIPRDAQAVAGYTSGRWPTFQHLRGQFPRALLLSVAVSAGFNADCLDIETGDATPGDAAAWYERQRAGGVTRPCLYASASMMESDVVPVLRAAGIDRASVRLWSAHYTGTPHICGPSSCRAMSIEADGAQWTNRAEGRNLDESLLAADFFGAVPAPKPAPKPAPVPWQEAIMNKLPVLSEGAEDRQGEVFYVHRMQALIKAVGESKALDLAACQEITGTFDAATKAALQQVQASWNVAADGVCGNVTWSVLITGSVP
jgi:peptidoglycan hydrolase-like protein with peptidoglycan-binding domain